MSQLEVANSRHKELSGFVETAQSDASSLKFQMANLLEEVHKLKNCLKRKKGISTGGSYRETKKLIKDLREKLVSEEKRNKQLKSSVIEARY